MILPKILQPRPPRLLMVLGGVTGSLLAVALVRLAPALGIPMIDLPLLAGRVFTSHAGPAFWVGHAIFVLAGAVVLPIVVADLWTLLPGHPVSLRGALLKGVSAGIVLWIVTGILLPPAARLASLADRPGFFAVELGVPAAVGLLLVHVAYGIAMTLVGGMSGGTRPMDTLGWTGFGYGDIREAALIHPSRKAYGKLGRSG